MTRVALYCRYSSDNQSDASIEDQVRLLEARADKEDWTVVAKFEDRAISGSTMIRPGIQALLREAQQGEFDIVLSESVDRLSRDMADIATMHKRLSWLGVEIVTLLEGEVSELHVGLKGTMSQLYLKDLRARTHRGLAGRAIAGESTGGKAFGYNVTPRYDERGKRIGGLRTINEAERAIVERIFHEFADLGRSPKAIAVGLNRDGIPAQGGREWGSSTIYGNRERGTGILNNELYIGKQVWNKQRFRKNPETGRTNGTLNDRSKWIVTDVPQFRMIDDALWRRAKLRQDETAHKGDFRTQRRPKRMFSFLLKCGECGGGFARSGSGYACSTRLNKGTCSNHLRISEKLLHQVVFGALRDKLMQPELCELFAQEYARQINAMQHEAVAHKANSEAELAGLEQKIARLITAIGNGVDPLLIRDEINAAQARKLKLVDELSAPHSAPVFIHPHMARRYSLAIAELLALRDTEHGHDEASEKLRSLIDKIVLTPNADRSDLTVDLYGDLAGILGIAANVEIGAYELGSDAKLELERVQRLATGTGGFHQPLGSHQYEGTDGCAPPQPEPRPYPANAPWVFWRLS